MENKGLIKVSKEQWNKIPKDYKGVWEREDLPKEYIGKRNVMSGCITKEPGCSLLTEGIHFIIVD